jgi:hypothetical protein
VLLEIILDGTDAALQALQYVKSPDGSFPNTDNFRTMLTVLVSYGDFSKANFKITEKAVQGHLSLEGAVWTGDFFHREVASNIDYSSLTAQFASRKSKVDFMYVARSYFKACSSTLTDCNPRRRIRMHCLINAHFSARNIKLHVPFFFVLLLLKT